MTLFLLTFAVLLFVIIKSKGYKLFINMFFWLSLFWVLIWGVYLTSGIKYKYGFSPQLICFFLMCLSLFLFCYSKGRKSAVRIFSDDTKISTKKWVIVGLVGSIMFIWDYIRLNGFNTSKDATDISLVGSIGSLLTPILLVLGLYLNAKKIKETGLYSVFGIILMMIYGLPCILNAGREAFLFVIIGIVSLVGYKSHLSEKKLKTSFKNKLFFAIFFVLGTGILLYVIFLISVNRFTENEINVLLTTNELNSKSMAEADMWGEFQFLYYNIASYFSQQIPFLDFTLQEYDGPFFFGVFELNIISRRLPDFLGLNYQLAYEELTRLYSKCGEDFSGGWNTVLGSLIIDFSWVGTIIVCCICGICLGKIQRKFESTMDVRYATLVSLICLSSFSTIQLGPFYQTSLYGSFIWWYLFFHKEETSKLKTKHLDRKFYLS